jgi:hypothetical protein
MFITTNQTKLDKSRDYGWMTAGLNLSPAHEASLVLHRPDLPSLCPKAGACAAVCLAKSGMNNFPTHIQIRAERTAYLHDEPDTALAQIIGELRGARRRALKAGLRFAVRPNLLSDQPKLAHRLAEALPDIQFYDYTKLPKPWLRTRPNYHLTFSYSERSSWAEVEACLAHGINVAVVFGRTKDQALPSHYRGIPTINGDLHDLRFLDAPNHLVALHFKGAHARIPEAVASGFVIDPKEI